MGSGCTEKRPPNRPIFCLGQPIFGFYSIATFFDHKTSIFFMNFFIIYLDQHLCQPETESDFVALFMRTLVFIALFSSSFWSTVYYRGTFSLYFYVLSTNHNPNHPIYTQKSKKFSWDFFSIPWMKYVWGRLLMKEVLVFCIWFQRYLSWGFL